ncbi:MAG: hypothetical protein KJ893_07390 [Candidatus Omnitrophica bacterium]|nr:hypothetical protein [Candidatus Omnitrophota bacterium]MBU4478948.1 hypothetical protein [Candidatus Omnitrophota bacterium]MCG2704002.1 hypothetical protein [Candidatus Omnitrophota bacterium]
MKRISWRFLVLWLCLMLSVFIVQKGELFAQTRYEMEDDVVTAEEQDQGVVSLDFKDADLKDVLKVFSQQSGLNFVATKDIEDKKITLYMSDVLVEDALRTLLQANNLGMEQSPNSNILIVKAKPTPPIATITRVYKMRYYYGSMSAKSLSGDKPKDSKSKESGWSDILKPLLSQFGVITSHGNLFVITDVPDRFKLIDQVISEIDKPIPEVMIEVELIETTSNFLKKLGVKWSEEMLKYQGPARITPIPFTPWEDYTSWGSENQARGSPLSGAVFQYGLISSTSLTWILNMLQTDTNTKFLAKPRILCQDREWAEIKITEDKIVSLITTIDNTTGITKTRVERMEVGTILRLVPLINIEEGFVSMLIEPSISRPTNSVFADSTGTKFIDPQKRSMRTVVMAGDGETIAVGGFITTEDEETKTKIPWLGDIPLFGALFRHSSTDRVDKELLIFITPRIVNPTEKVEMMIQGQPELPAAGREQQPVEKKAEQPDLKEGRKQAESVPAVPAAISGKKDLPFREQEDMVDLKLDLTLKSSSLGVVDLVK